MVEHPTLDLPAIRRTLKQGEMVSPALVLELVEWCEKAEGRIQALMALGDADGPITRQMIVATLLMPRNTGDLDAYVDAVQMLLRTALAGALARAEQAESDVAAWRHFVGDIADRMENHGNRGELIGAIRDVLRRAGCAERNDGGND